MRADAGVEFGEFGAEGLVIGHQGAELDKGADDGDAHLDGAITAEDVTQLDGSVFGEGKRKILDVLSPL